MSRYSSRGSKRDFLPGESFALESDERQGGTVGTISWTKRDREDDEGRQQPDIRLGARRQRSLARAWGRSGFSREGLCNSLSPVLPSRTADWPAAEVDLQGWHDTRASEKRREKGRPPASAPVHRGCRRSHSPLVRCSPRASRDRRDKGGGREGSSSIYSLSRATHSALPSRNKLSARVAATKPKQGGAQRRGRRPIEQRAEAKQIDSRKVRMAADDASAT